MRVSVIIVNWNGEHLLPDCLASLRAQTFRDFETIVVDNGSRKVPKVEDARLIRLYENRGFAGGNNAGIEKAKGEFIALLNNDARADKEWLASLVKAADLYPDAGMFASLILRADGKIDSAGCTVHPDGNGMCRGRHYMSGPVTFPSGCAAMYRKSMLDQIGPFDESFFMYNEDTELGIRAQKAGWKCVYVPQAVVNHLYSQSSSAYSLKKLFYVERNRIKIMLKHFTPSQIIASIPWTFARYFNLIRGMA
jgi:GT2 family glycosyltransferase